MTHSDLEARLGAVEAQLDLARRDSVGARQLGRDETDGWWLNHIEEQGLLRPEKSDGYILQTPIGKVLCSDGSLRDDPITKPPPLPEPAAAKPCPRCGGSGQIEVGTAKGGCACPECSDIQSQADADHDNRTAAARGGVKSCEEVAAAIEALAEPGSRFATIAPVVAEIREDRRALLDEVAKLWWGESQPAHWFSVLRAKALR